MHHKLAALGLAVLAMGFAQPAAAVLVSSGNGTLAEDAPLQAGRTLRNATISTWASPKTWPGLNDNFSRRYTTISIGFAPNAVQDVYYRLSLGQPSTFLFGVAYNGAFNPADLSENYVGDPGSSSPSALWEVIVPTGGSLLLVVNEVALTTDSFPFTYSIEAFSDANGGENFGVVPEPASWAMLIAGFGLVGAVQRRRRVAAAV